VWECELLHGCSLRVSCQQELLDLMCTRFWPQKETDLFVRVQQFDSPGQRHMSSAAPETELHSNPIFLSFFFFLNT